MKFFIYNFLCVPSLTIEFGVAFLTVVFTILSLLIFGVNASELSSMFSEKLIVFATILLLLLTWLIAVVGASMRSRKLITFTIVLWTIFIIMWLVLSLFFRVIKLNTQYCVADNKRCAPSMWLVGKGGENDGEENPDETKDPDETEDPDQNEDEELRRRLWLKNGSPEINIKTFHPTRVDAVVTPVLDTRATDTVLSNRTSVMIGVNDGYGCERHQRTTAESPPSDLITRVMEYRKNMTMYRQTAVSAIQQRKKKGRKKNVDDDDEEEKEEEEEEEGEKGGDGSASTEKGDSSPPIDLLFMSVFLRKIPIFFSANHFQSSHCTLHYCHNDGNHHRTMSTNT